MKAKEYQKRKDENLVKDGFYVKEWRELVNLHRHPYR